jgi:parallel beta-helix repeat protein
MRIARTILTLFLLCVPTSALILKVAEKNATALVPYSGSIIQEAINNATEGDIITIPAGTYYEHVVVNKTLTLIGENNSTTIIDGSNTGTVVTIEASNVTISGFTIQNSGNISEDKKYPIDCGIKVNATSTPIQNITIANNIIMNNSVGIYAKCSSSNAVANNAFSNNVGPPYYWAWEWINESLGKGHRVFKGTVDDDVYFSMSNLSELTDNQGMIRLFNCSYDTLLNNLQVSLSFSDANTIKEIHNETSVLFSSLNVITNCTGRIFLSSAHNNTVAYNSGSIELNQSDCNLIKNNKLEPGKSLVETVDRFPAYRNHAGSANNTIENNILTNGSIQIGAEDWAFSDDNTIVNNTLDGGSIMVYGSRNVVNNNSVSGNDTGIRISMPVSHEGNNIVSENTATNSAIGIHISAQGTRVDRNVMKFNDLGLLLGSGNIVTNNTIIDNVHGVYVPSDGNTLRENKINGNKYGFICTLYASIAGQDNDIDTTNVVNGKSIHYLVNRTNLDINPSTFPNIGYLGLVNCSNVTVQGLTLTGNGEGIMISGCTNCSIEENTIKDNIIALHAHMNQSTIRNNEILSNWHGITASGTENQIVGNNITANTIRLAPYHYPEDLHWRMYELVEPVFKWMTWDGVFVYAGGIYLWLARNCTLTGNIIVNNEQGIFLHTSSFNFLRNNTMTNNTHNFGIYTEHLKPTEWILNPPNASQISPYLNNNVDASNMINGKPIYWLINRQGEQVPADAGCVILVNSTKMTLKDLVLQSNFFGVLLIDDSDIEVTNCVITTSRYAIQIKPTLNLTKSSNVTIDHCSILENGVAIYLEATNCIISHNLIDRNLAGIYVKRGCDLNLITRNIIANNIPPPREEWILGYHMPNSAVYEPGTAIVLYGANNTICYNTIQTNECGINGAYGGRDNWIHHNNFINNTVHAVIFDPTGSYYPNTWDNGYPSGGNYWSNVNETDLFSGPCQNITGSDGIGDLPLRIAHRNTDQYPLMAPINTFDAGTWNNVTYAIDLVSNSTSSAFHFDPKEGALLWFGVVGEDGTSGFCRVSIPKELLTVEDGCTVLVGFEPVNYTMMVDESCSYLYFTYNHSAKTVYVIGTGVIPEFPSLSVLFPLMILFVFPLVLAIKLKTRLHGQF